MICSNLQVSRDRKKNC